MQQTKFYTQAPLAYGYRALGPYISEEQLRIHYEKHHQAYIKAANAIFEKLDTARKEQADLDMKATLKELSFNVGGHLLHSLFWENLAPAGKYEKPTGILEKEITSEFGSFERFKKEFTQAALSVEGSGWAALTYCKRAERPIIMQFKNTT